MSFVGCSERVTVDDVRACCAGIDGVADGVVGAAIDEALYQFDLATDFAFRGECSALVRPCSVTLSAGCPACSCSPCSCLLDGAVRLPFLPVRSVTEVLIDGVVFADWRLVPGSNLVVRTDGLEWPDTQDLAVAAGAVGSWSVEFEWGVALPPGAGRRVAGYACELSRSCSGLPCSLPERARLQRKGDVEFVVYDNYRAEGLTGFPPIDDWIAVWRGGRARIRPSMARPGRRPTTTLG